MRFVKLIKSDNYNDFSQKIYDEFESQLLIKPSSIVSFNCCENFEGFYNKIVLNGKKGSINLSDFKFVFAEEFLDVGLSDANSVFSYFKENLFRPANIAPYQIIYPEIFFNNKKPHDVVIKDLKMIDLLILELGANGELGYYSSFVSERDPSGATFLTPDSKEKISMVKNDWAPKGQDFIYSLGSWVITQSKKIVLVAKGIDKLNAVARLLRSTYFQTNFPASLLIYHPNVTLLLDYELSQIFKS